MISVVPYIDTIGTDKFREFLKTPFKMEMLETIFKGWEKDPKHDTLQQEYWCGETVLGFGFDGSEYAIHRDTILPFPTNINDFINDMTRFGITLYWADDMLVKFSPKDMYSPEKIREYYTGLLEKLEKDHELL